MTWKRWNEKLMEVIRSGGSGLKKWKEVAGSR